jgi:hypothetical protein
MIGNYTMIKTNHSGSRRQQFSGEERRGEERRREEKRRAE